MFELLSFFVLVMYQDQNFNVCDSYNDDNGGLATNTHEVSDGDSDDELRKHFLVTSTEHAQLPISHTEVLAAIHKRPLLNLEKLNTSQKHHTHCILHFSCLLRCLFYSSLTFFYFFVNKDYPLTIQIFRRRRKQGFRLDNGPP